MSWFFLCTRAQPAAPSRSSAVDFRATRMKTKLMKGHPTDPLDKVVRCQAFVSRGHPPPSADTAQLVATVPRVGEVCVPDGHTLTPAPPRIRGNSAVVQGRSLLSRVNSELRIQPYCSRGTQQSGRNDPNSAPSIMSHNQNGLAFHCCMYCTSAIFRPEASTISPY